MVKIEDFVADFVGFSLINLVFFSLIYFGIWVNNLIIKILATLEAMALSAIIYSQIYR